MKHFMVSLLITLTIGTVVLSVAGLSFQKVEKDLNGIRDDEDLLFELEKLPKARRQAVSEVKENDLPMSAAQTGNQQNLEAEASQKPKENAEPKKEASDLKSVDAVLKHDEASKEAAVVKEKVASQEAVAPKSGTKGGTSNGGISHVSRTKEADKKQEADDSMENDGSEETSKEATVSKKKKASKEANIFKEGATDAPEDAESKEISAYGEDDDSEEDDSWQTPSPRDRKKKAKLLANAASIGSAITEPTIFSLANTDVGRSWEGIPFRERYLWGSHDALCHPFDLPIPHARGEHGSLPMCLYRKEISKTVVLTEEIAQMQNAVFGFVKGHPKSTVKGTLLQGRFFGEIFMGHGPDPSYIVEDVQALVMLMEHSEKLLRNLQIIMNLAKGQWSEKSDLMFNAIVTTGKSLESFMSLSGDEQGPPSFLALSTAHNSFIISGQPKMSFDEKGRILFSIGEEVITIGNDATVSLTIKSKDEEYKFRPNGQSILLEGLNVTNLEGQVGPVAVFAVSEVLDYGCLIPSPAFSNVRKGGFVCKVCAGLDESFSDGFTFPTDDADKDVYDFVGEMLDRVSWIFRSVDWNKDGKYDDIGISYDPQIFSGDYSDFPKNLTFDELEALYEHLAGRDFTGCCLGIMFTMKQLPGDLYAKSSLEKAGTGTGVCAFKREEDGVWNNVILISGSNKHGSFTPMTPDQLQYLTAHEIGKAFGAALDATGNPTCDSFEDAMGVRRHFLLWPDVVRNVSVEEKALSPCSLENIHQVLDTCQSSCFELTHEPYCGNGIIEMGEECDCGSEINCAHEPCCFPRNGKFPCQSTGLECKKLNSGTPAGTLPVAPFMLAGLIALSYI